MKSEPSKLICQIIFAILFAIACLINLVWENCNPIKNPKEGLAQMKRAARKRITPNRGKSDAKNGETRRGGRQIYEKWKGRPCR